jgi:hypothetical protein
MESERLAIAHPFLRLLFSDSRFLSFTWGKVKQWKNKKAQAKGGTALNDSVINQENSVIIKELFPLARLGALEVFRHIIIRGIQRRNISKDNRDRENYLERLGKLLLGTKTGCYAWVFLPNYFFFAQT